MLIGYANPRLHHTTIHAKRIGGNLPDYGEDLSPLAAEGEAGSGSETWQFLYSITSKDDCCSFGGAVENFNGERWPKQAILDHFTLQSAFFIIEETGSESQLLVGHVEEL